jgi:uncharacterized membrane protein YukC
MGDILGIWAMLGHAKDTAFWIHLGRGHYMKQLQIALG